MASERQAEPHQVGRLMDAQEARRKVAEQKAERKAARSAEAAKQAERNRARIRSERRRVPGIVAAIEARIAEKAAEGENRLYEAWKYGGVVDDTVERATAEAIRRSLTKKGFEVDFRHWPIYPSINSEGYSSGSTTHYGRIEVKW